MLKVCWMCDLLFIYLFKCVIKMTTNQTGYFPQSFLLIYFTLSDIQ